MPIPHSAMQATTAPLDTRLQVVEGQLPSYVSGHLFVIGAAPQRDTHLFNGDGLVVRVDFNGKAPPTVKRRVVQDPSRRADGLVQTDCLLRFRNADLARYSPVLGVRNELNTAFLTMPERGRLFATYDAGRPWELDPETLDVVTPVGRLDEWQPGFALIDRPGIRLDPPWAFPPILSGAHPAYDDRTGEVFLVNWSMGELGTGGSVRLLRWDGSGPVQSWRVTDAAGQDLEVQSMHQLAVNERWVVLADTAFVLEFGRLLVPRWPMRKQRPDTRLMLVDREDLRPGSDRVTATTLTIPREMVHFTADYRLLDGRLVLHAGHPCASDASEALRRRDRRWDTGQPVRRELTGFVAGPTDVDWKSRSQFYALASTGFKSGAFDSLAFDGTQAATPLLPEEVDNYEVGVKTTLPGGFGSLNVTGFHMDYQNLQLVQFTGIGATGGVNLPSADINGIELDAQLTALPSTVLDIGYTYLDTDAESPEPDGMGGTVIVDGRRLVRSAKHDFSASLLHELALAGGGRLDFGANVSHRSKVFDDPDNNDLEVRPARTLLDGFVTWTTPDAGWRLTLWAKNITDEDYVIRVSNIANFNQVVVGPPRRVGVTVSANFD